MNEVLSAIAPGLLIALTPAILTIAYQLVARQRESTRQRRERLVNVFLDLESEAQAITFQGVFTDAHASVVSKSTSSIALLLGFLQPFDLTGMSYELTRHMSRLNRLANELLASTEQESTHAAVKRAVDATTRVLECYMTPKDNRTTLQRLWSSRPPLDAATAELRVSEMTAAFRELGSILETRRKPGRRSPKWP